MSTTIIQKIKETLARGQEIGAMIQGSFVYVFLGDKRDLWPTLNVGLDLAPAAGRSKMLLVSVVENEDCLTLTPEKQPLVSALKVGFGNVVLIEPSQG